MLGGSAEFLAGAHVVFLGSDGLAVGLESASACFALAVDLGGFPNPRPSWRLLPGRLFPLGLATPPGDGIARRELGDESPHSAAWSVRLGHEAHSTPDGGS
jgi:hypothetical protein